MHSYTRDYYRTRVRHITATFHFQLLDKGPAYTGIGGNLVSIVFTCFLWFICSATPSLVVQLLQHHTLGVTTDLQVAANHAFTGQGELIHHNNSIPYISDTTDFVFELPLLEHFLTAVNLGTTLSSDLGSIPDFIPSECSHRSPN